jgi:hypothetical protein
MHILGQCALSTCRWHARTPHRAAEHPHAQELVESDTAAASGPRGFGFRRHSAFSVCAPSFNAFSLSSRCTQELVDCDREVDMGCEGGMMNSAYAFILQVQALIIFS